MISFVLSEGERAMKTPASYVSVYADGQRVMVMPAALLQRSHQRAIRQLGNNDGTYLKFIEMCILRAQCGSASFR